MPWIQHPACDDEPVSWMRWFKWKLSEKLDDWHRALEYDALYPNCEDCGKPRKNGDHSKCEEIPF